MCRFLTNTVRRDVVCASSINIVDGNVDGNGNGDGNDNGNGNGDGDLLFLWLLLFLFLIFFVVVGICLELNYFWSYRKFKEPK